MSDCLLVTPSQLADAFQAMAIICAMFSAAGMFVGHAVSRFLDRMAWRAMRRAEEKRRMVTM